ncbi:c-type cytochrome [Hyphomicrobium sulfonivorans]|uniref:c-type cytochrome n=1 Tax=Hyphomicrobium sulfonivorans TaxID=121290 RepID=UPI00156F53F2|nr:cytochrome c [Hyphomicrobium sulfonivorans]MBI1649690.1 cytochrome c [Hyphomicrobium sulfonivorans]NSL71604.1 cytochrome C [Hyphomicrobium sulfonivorans]
MRHVLTVWTLLLLLSVASFAAERAPATLNVAIGNSVQRYTADELLARRDATAITVPDDVSYGRKMHYRAVPLLALVGDSAAGKFDTLEVKASDGFASQLPLELVRKGAAGGSVAWLAVEDPKAPWPDLPGKKTSAGPFYLIWQYPERSGIGSEQWPYAAASITAVASPALRWPQMTVAETLPADALARHGQQVFTVQCMPCHRMNDAGVSDVGPDLGTPMNPTQYLTPSGLRALIRDPKAVRTWPAQQMPAFDEGKLSEADLDALIAYLDHMAER